MNTTVHVRKTTTKKKKKEETKKTFDKYYKTMSRGYGPFTSREIMKTTTTTKTKQKTGGKLRFNLLFLWYLAKMEFWIYHYYTCPLGISIHKLHLNFRKDISFLLDCRGLYRLVFHLKARKGEWEMWRGGRGNYVISCVILIFGLCPLTDPPPARLFIVLVFVCLLDIWTCTAL